MQRVEKAIFCTSHYLGRSKFWLPLLFAVALIAAENNNVIEITGKIVRGSSADALQFRSDQGETYKLIRNDHSEALFIDRDLHSKKLLLKGRVRAQEQFEITGNLHSIKDGKVHELFYYCLICSVKTSFPGPCVCCREPVELHEEPVKD